MMNTNLYDRLTVVPLAASAHYRPLVDAAQTSGILHKYGVPTPYVLYVGSAAARKNITRLLRAFAEVHPQHPGMHLVVAGVPHWRSSPLAALVDRLALGDSLYFTGFVDEADLPALYSAAQLFVFPSLMEGFGLPVLEAMACGTPVITADGSSLREVAGDAARLVDPHSVASIAAAMHELLGSADRAELLRQKGLERVRNFSWQRVAQQTLDVYRRVADSE